MTYQTGDKVLVCGKEIADVVRVYKNGKVKVSFWVHTLGMVNPELWTQTVWANALSPRT